MRTTIVLKEQTAKKVIDLARNEDRKLSNMVGVLVAEALAERERAARRAEHAGAVLKRQRSLAPPEEHARSAKRLRDALDA